MVRRVHVEHRHLDPADGAKLARAVAHGLGIFPRPRRLPAAAPDHALYAARRRPRRSARQAADAAGVSVRADVDVGGARRARLLRIRPRLAHPGAVVRHRLRAGVRRPGVSVAHPVARRQEGSAERRRAQLDPVQRGARPRAAGLRRDARRQRALGLRRPAGHGHVLRAQLALVSRGDLRADVAASATSRTPARPACATSSKAGWPTSAGTAAWSRSSSSRRRRHSWDFRC